MRQRRLYRIRGITHIIALLACSITGAIWAPPASALDQIFRQTDVDLSSEAQLLQNPSFDQGETVPEKDGKGVQLAEWDFWQEGYVIVPGAGRDGTRAIQCSITDKELQYGAGQRVELNQQEPHPVVASAWSRAQDVSGSPDTGYSIYCLSSRTNHLVARTSNFSTGRTMEKRHSFVVPKSHSFRIRVLHFSEPHRHRVL